MISPGLVSCAYIRAVHTEPISCTKLHKILNRLNGKKPLVQCDIHSSAHFHFPFFDDILSNRKRLARICRETLTNETKFLIFLPHKVNLNDNMMNAY